MPANGSLAEACHAATERCAQGPAKSFTSPWPCWAAMVGVMTHHISFIGGGYLGEGSEERLVRRSQHSQSAAKHFVSQLDPAGTVLAKRGWLERCASGAFPALLAEHIHGATAAGKVFYQYPAPRRTLRGRSVSGARDEIAARHRSCSSATRSVSVHRRTRVRDGRRIGDNEPRSAA